MPIKKVTDANLKNKRVLLRVDFNVLDKQGKIESDFRIRAAIPTINYLIKHGAAQIVIAAHAGRPEGKVVPQFSLKPIAARLRKLLKKNVILTPNWALPKAAKLVMLENLRFHKEEEKNSSQFAKKLAQLADIYVNDAFGVSHRANASVAAITKYLPSYAGLLLEKEIQALSKVRDNPAKPLIVIIGGAKSHDKIPVIKNLIKKAHRILLAGAAANTFLKAHHYNIFESLHEEDQVKNAHELLHKNMAKIILPLDVVVAREKKYGFDRQSKRETSIDDIHAGEAILDIGDYTLQKFVEYLRQAKTIFWAGPIGNTDFPQFSKGTEAIARVIAASQAYSVVGGGETVAAIEKFGLLNKISHASTGGGAALEFLSGKVLPGIEALEHGA